MNHLNHIVKKGLLVAFVFASAITVHAQTVLNLSTGNQTSGTTNVTPVRSVQETTDGYIITYTFASANLKSDDIYTNAYDYEYNDFGVTHDTAKPALPVRYEQFFVPEGKQAAVSVISSQYRDFSLELAPAKPLCIESATLTASDVPAISTYSGFYPANLVSVVKNEIYRNVEVVTIGIMPVQYNMQTKKVRSFTELKFKVQFDNAEGVGLTDGPGDYETYLLLNFQYQSGVGGTSGSGEVVINPSFTPDEPVNKDYLIISVPEFEDKIDDFCEWKQTLGFSTHVAYNSNWTTSSINDTITEFASTHPDFTHLLLFGDYDFVPSVQYHDGPFNFENYHSDLSYACIVGNDDYPDVLYGRIPVNNSTDANTIVQKIINYEKEPVSSADFFKTLSFAALFDYNLIGNNSVRESDRQYTKNCEDIRSRLINKGYSSNYVYRLYPMNSQYNPMKWYSGDDIPLYLKRPQYNWNGNADDISSAINAGSSYFLYRGHGDVDCWYAEGSKFYTNSDIENLTNGSKLPVIYSLCCENGRLDDNTKTSFAETFLSKKNGGCASIIAATNVSYTYDNNNLSEGIYDAMWPKNNSINPVYELGAVLRDAFAKAEHYNYNSLYQRRIYHCYGDPSLKLFTTEPQTVNGVTVTRTENTLKVKCNKPMYISVYDLIKKKSDLVYGTQYFIAYAKDLDGNVDGNPRALTVCVYNNNFKPDINPGLIRIPQPFTPPVLNSCEVTPDQNLNAGYDTLDGVSSAQIIVTDIYGNQKIVQDCEPDSEETTFSISALNKGVYVVSLMVDGQISGSKRIIK